MGTSSKQLLLSVCLGLEDLVRYIKAQGESQFFIGGFFKHWVGEVKVLTSIVAMSSRVSDRILKLVMKDDRLPMVLPEIDRAMVEELRALVAVPECVWAFFRLFQGCQLPR